MVERKIYMDKIKKLQDQQIIKVVTGVRRCGKSTLLRQFQSYLLNTGVEQEQIIAINFEDVENEGLLDYHALHSYVTERLVPGKMTYIFLDEVQAVPNFQKAVDSLFLRENTDIYITGHTYFLVSLQHFSLEDILRFLCCLYLLRNIWNYPVLKSILHGRSIFRTAGFHMPYKLMMIPFGMIIWTAFITQF